MNNEAFITKYHASLKQAYSGSSNLSILFGQNTFMFAVLSEDYKHCIELGHVEINAGSMASDPSDTLVFLIHNFLLHQKKFDKVQLSLLSGDFTLLPEAFAANTDSKTILNFAAGFSKAAITRQHHLSGLNFLYAVDQKLMTVIENTFLNVSVRHAGASSIDLLMSHHSLLNTNVLLTIYDTSFELLIKEHNKLIFYNNFRYENNEDILYYLLFTMEQFGLDPLHTKLSLAAQMETSGDLARSIKKYVKQLSFVNHLPSLSLEGEMTNLPQHYYFTVLNQHVCEL